MLDKKEGSDKAKNVGKWKPGINNFFNFFQKKLTFFFWCDNL